MIAKKNDLLEQVAKLEQALVNSETELNKLIENIVKNTQPMKEMGKKVVTSEELKRILEKLQE